jgi:hypothetical protein
MASESLAVTKPRLASAPVADQYEAFHEVLAAGERGRAFLAEHARRSRAAETDVLLATLARIEALVRANASPQTDAVRAELRMLVTTIRSARPDIEQSALPTRAAKLAALLSLLEERIVALAGPLPATPDSAPEVSRTHLAMVPPPQEPELPIPTPAVQPPAITLAPLTVRPHADMTAAGVQPAAAGGEAGPAAKQESRISLAIAEYPDARRPAPAAKTPERPTPKAKMPEPPAPADDAKLWALSDAKLAPAPPDPLAAIMLLSEEERIALFT